MFQGSQRVRTAQSVVRRTLKAPILLIQQVTERDQTIHKASLMIAMAGCVEGGGVSKLPSLRTSQNWRRVTSCEADLLLWSLVPSLATGGFSRPLPLMSSWPALEVPCGCCLCPDIYSAVRTT